MSFYRPVSSREIVIFDGGARPHDGQHQGSQCRRRGEGTRTDVAVEDQPDTPWQPNIFLRSKWQSLPVSFAVRDCAFHIFLVSLTDGLFRV